MRTRIPSCAILGLLGVLIAGPRPHAQQSKTDQLPSFRSGVELVTVEVGVVDKNGQPLRDLKPEDFKVTVAGQARRIVTAEFIEAGTRSVPGDQAEIAPVSTNEGGGVGRLFLFVVDSNSLEAGEARHVGDATARFFAGLNVSDRSGLISLPIGRRIAFTWAHDRVREALRAAAMTGGMPSTYEYGNLSEARDIATRGAFALREVASRECATTLSAGTLGGPMGGTPGQGPQQTQPQGGATGGAGESPRPGSSGNQQPAGGGAMAADWAMDRCLRDVQTQAEMTWSVARSNSLASIMALRETLRSLQQVQGDKNVILISGGWPMDEHDENSLLTTIAADAAAARATLFTVFVPRQMMSATRRSVNLAPRNDQMLYRWGVENLASMTGGRAYSADANIAGMFDRLSRELSGFYRIGVEKNAADGGATGRRMKVQVTRENVSVRAREIFDIPKYEDRDWSARLASAMDSPVPASALGLRLTSYLAPDSEDPASVRLLLAGDLSRFQPGDATLHVLVRDLQGNRITGGEQRLVGLAGETVSFATHIGVRPGSYLVRLAIQDAAGRVGSVDHRVEARPVALGSLTALGPILVRVSANGRGEPHLALDRVQTDERLALEINLSGDSDLMSRAAVNFEIASTPEGPPLVEQPARIGPASGDRGVIAQAVTDIRLLPAGQYVARARITAGDTALGTLHRSFFVPERANADTSLVTGGVAATGNVSAAPARAGTAAMVPRFAVRNLLTRPTLDALLTRVAARPDAAFPGVSQLLERARTDNLADITVPDAQAVQTPVAAFVRGLALLAQNKFDPAAASFRTAMRASPDFYPAMVYLGACFAAAGNDKEAAAIWRTALIKEGGTPEVHLLLADALLRQGNGAPALQVVSTARSRWPEDNDLKRRFVLASVMAGDTAAGLEALDDLVRQGAEDEPTLALGLLTLYESLSKGHAIAGADQDRARLMRFADAYRTRGGASLALVETWVAAINGRSRK